ncbi:MAG: DMT family transporter [Alphaproteobacteria bacterium]|nr:DMT family transporter [Alphaproteobacteria bacterium]
MTDKLPIKSATMLFPTILLLVGGIAYGSMFSANKFIVEAGLPIAAYAFWQALFSSGALLVGAALKRDLPPVNFGALKLYALVAVTGMVGPLLVFSSVADRVPAGILTLIVALIPTTTYALSLMLGVDRFRWLNLAGVALGFGGILLIVLPNGSLSSPEAAIWVVFALLVPLLAAINNVYGERLAPPKAGSLGLASGMMAVGAVILFIVMMARDGFVLPTDAGNQGLLVVLWATAAQSITYACFFEIVRRAGGAFFALLNYVVVAAGLIWASVLFGDRLSFWVWIAVAVLSVSLALTNMGTAAAMRERRRIT